MSRRDRLRAQREATIRSRHARLSRREQFDVEPPDPARELDRLTLAMLPLRAFLGATFVYAGLDKILDPAFLQATGPGSIGAQLDSFVRVSPLAPLVQLFGQPFPVAIGLVIAVAEIAVGLGALTGLLFRLAAAGGFALSVLFWLTASWAIKPYYYGPDLPYALGWLTLALAGTGGRFTIETWVDREFDGGALDEPVSPERRLVLKAGFLGLAAVVVAGLAGTVGASVLGRQRPGVGGTISPDSPGATDAPADASTDAPTDVPSPSATDIPAADTPAAGTPAASVAASPVVTAAPPSGPVVAHVSQLASGRAVSFDDPITGDPAVVIRLRDGRFVAYDTVCTHAGCTVGYDRASGYLICPCHGAAFDPAHAAAVIAGPADQPLGSLPIHVDTASGRITLTG